jgi:predicted transcriptional regulator
MRRPNIRLKESIDLALALVARSENVTKSEIVEQALTEYLLKNYPDVCKMAEMEENK